MEADIFVFEGVINWQPINLVLFDLPVNPVLDPGEVSYFLDVLERVHVEEVVPQTVNIVDMRHEVLAPSLEGALVREADVALAISFVLNFLLGVPLLGELIDDDGGDDVAEQDLEEPPVDQIRNEAAVVVLFVLPAHAFPDDLLGVEGTHAGDDGVAVLIYAVDVDVDLLVLVQGPYVVVEGDEPEDERECQGEQAHEHQLLPGQPNRLQYTFQQLDFREGKNKGERINPHLEEAGVD